MVSILAKRFGYEYFEDITDSVQDAFESAIRTWKFGSIPTNPSGWLFKVAQNNLLNKLKRKKISNLHYEYYTSFELQENEAEESALKLLIHCSSMQVSNKKKIIFLLYFLCGFSYNEIAAALFLNLEGVKKMILRNKETFKRHAERFDNFDMNMIKNYDIPIQVIYLLFNAGYKSSKNLHNIQLQLCFEAIRLAKLLHSYIPSNAKLNSLLALMFFNVSRFPARVSKESWVTLEKQNRKKWNFTFIFEGFYYLNVAKDNLAEEIETYYLEALISSIHCSSLSYQSTDWKSISFLYRQLEILKPDSLTVKLNRLIAESNVKNVNLILSELDSFEQSIDDKLAYYFYTTKAHLCLKLQNHKLAIDTYQKALQFTHNKFDINFVKQKVEDIKGKYL